MELVSPIHGTITYSKEEIISFKKGIPGFEEYTQYIIKEIKESEPFKLLQSVDNKELGFIIISPFEVVKDYEIELRDYLIKDLEIASSQDVLLYSLVTLNSNIQKVTANLKAPIIINNKACKGAQFIVDKEEYKTKHPVM